MDLDEGLRMLTLRTPELVNFGEWLDESSTDAAEAEAPLLEESATAWSAERLNSFPSPPATNMVY